MISLKLVTDATTEPVTTAEIKSHLRIDHSNDDTLLDNYIKSARRWTERVTGRCLINQTWDLWLDKFPSDQTKEWWNGVRQGSMRELYNLSTFIEVPKVPFASVSKLSTYSDADVETQFSSANYFVDTNQEPGRITLRIGASWPTGTFRNTSAIQVRFVAGYGSTASSVPEDIKTALKMVTALYYENRGDADEKELQNALVLLRPYLFKRI